MDDFLALPPDEQEKWQKRHREIQDVYLREHVTDASFYACIRAVLPREQNRRLLFTAFFKNDTDAWLFHNADEPLSVSSDPDLASGVQDGLVACALKAFDGKRVPFGAIGGADEDLKMVVTIFPY